MGCVNEDCEFKILACQRLAEYEDIGLTPEQLLEIDKMYSEKCRTEVEKLLKEENPEGPEKLCRLSVFDFI